MQTGNVFHGEITDSQRNLANVSFSDEQRLSFLRGMQRLVGEKEHRLLEEGATPEGKQQVEQRQEAYLEQAKERGEPILNRVISDQSHSAETEQSVKELFQQLLQEILPLIDHGITQHYAAYLEDLKNGHTITDTRVDLLAEAVVAATGPLIRSGELDEAQKLDQLANQILGIVGAKRIKVFVAEELHLGQIVSELAINDIDPARSNYTPVRITAIRETGVDAETLDGELTHRYSRSCSRKTKSGSAFLTPFQS